MRQKKRQYDFPEFEDNSFTPSGSPVSKLWGGIVAPIVLALSGLYSVIVQKSFTFGLRYPSKFEGTEAVFWGIGLLFLAALLHFHHYWTVSEKLWKYSGLLKIIAIIGALISFGLMFWTSFSNIFT